MRYTHDHLWLELEENGTYRIGLTPYALEQVGELVYIAFADLGKHDGKEIPFAVVESTKAATDLFLDFDYELIAVNKLLPENPQILVQDPSIYFVRIRPINEQMLLHSTLCQEEYLKAFS